MVEAGAGIGLVRILRWYWWRVNAWSEITAMVAPAIAFLYLKLFTSIVFPYTLLYLVAWTTVCWIVVTLATPPEPDAHLVAFYRRVRPGGPGWGRIARLAGGPPPEAIGGLLVDWIAGWILIYAVLFGIGSVVLGSIDKARPACALPWRAHRDLSRRGWKVSRSSVKSGSQRSRLELRIAHTSHLELQTSIIVPTSLSSASAKGSVGSDRPGFLGAPGRRTAGVLPSSARRPRLPPRGRRTGLPTRDGRRARRPVRWRRASAAAGMTPTRCSVRPLWAESICPCSCWSRPGCRPRIRALGADWGDRAACVCGAVTPKNCSRGPGQRALPLRAHRALASEPGVGRRSADLIGGCVVVGMDRP